MSAHPGCGTGSATAHGRLPGEPAGVAGCVRCLPACWRWVRGFRQDTSRPLAFRLRHSPTRPHTSPVTLSSHASSLHVPPPLTPTGTTSLRTFHTKTASTASSRTSGSTTEGIRVTLRRGTTGPIQDWKLRQQQRHRSGGFAACFQVAGSRPHHVLGCQGGVGLQARDRL
eukprot:365202-Chlamydomonas_euryale.AAC.4